MIKAYLAARYERRGELLGYIERLADAGIEVTSTWLTLEMDNLANAAQMDLNEIRSADMLIFFSEDPLTAWVRGSRCVEYGYALAAGKQIIVIGQRENCFHWLLPDSAFFESVKTFVEHVYVKSVPIT